MLSKIADHSSFSTENPVAKVNNDSESQVASADVLDLDQITNVQYGSPRKFGAAKRMSKIRPEDCHLTKACDDAGFLKKCLSLGQLFVTIHLERFWLYKLMSRIERIFGVTTVHHRRDLFEPRQKLAQYVK